MKIPEHLRFKHHAEYQENGYVWEAFNGAIQFAFPDLEINSNTVAVSLWHNSNGIWKRIEQTTGYKQENASLWTGYFDGLETDERYIICPTSEDYQIADYNTRYDFPYIIYKGELDTGKSGITVNIDSERSKTIYNDHDFLPELYNDYDSITKITLAKIDFSEEAQNQCVLKNYSEEARNIFFETCFQCTELHPILGKFGNIPSLQFEYLSGDYYGLNQESIPFTREGRLTRFPDGKKIYVLCKNVSSNRNAINSVRQWQDEINALLPDIKPIHVVVIDSDGTYPDFNKAEQKFSDGCYIRLQIDDYEEDRYLGNDNWDWGDGTTYGEMYRTDWDPITGATLGVSVHINVGNKKDFYKSVLYEELTQALGCVNDVYCSPTSLFSQFQYKDKINGVNWFFERSGEPTADGQVIQMLYKEFQPGTKASDAIFKLMPTTGGIIGLPFCYADHYDGCYTYNINTFFTIYRRISAQKLDDPNESPILTLTKNISENDFPFHYSFLETKSHSPFQSYIPYWSWEKSNGTATEYQTRCAFSAIDKENGYGINSFSHYVWNDIVNKVYQLLLKNGMNWTIPPEGGLSFADTKMNYGNRKLTKKRVLSLMYNIDCGMATLDSEKGLYTQFHSYIMSDGVCKGNIFSIITNKINAWRDGYIGDRLYLTSKETPDIESSNIEDYKTYGAFFYKYGYTHNYLSNQGTPLAKGAKIIIDPRQLRLKNNVDNIINNYIYLGCIGNENAPLEFGIFTAPDRGGKWYRYSKQTYPANAMHFGEEIILKPDNEFPNSKGEYTYTNSSMISIELEMSALASDHFNFNGKIKVLSSPDYNCETSSLTINAGFNYVSGIGNSKNTNSFFLGVTAPPDNIELEYQARKESYIKHVIFQSYIKTEQNSWYPWYPVDGPKADKIASNKNVKRNIISKKAISSDEIRKTDQLGYAQWELTTRAEIIKYIYNLIGEFQNQDYRWLKNNNYNPYHYYTVLAPPQFVTYFKNPVTLEEDVSISYE